jgi:hypothetical protein
LNAIYYKWRGVNFSPGRIEFFCKEWTKTVKDLHWGIAARNIFLVFEKENVFLENKKRTFNKVRVFQNFKLFSTT